MFNKYALWGRSMGAACAMFYTSIAFRHIMGEEVYGKSYNNEIRDPFYSSVNDEL